MRYATTPRFDADYQHLRPEHRRQFAAVIPSFNRAVEQYVDSGGANRFPAALRVKPMKSARGIWELTWSFASPDGRATFEIVNDEHGPLVRWRRIGDHSIYREP